MTCYMLIRSQGKIKEENPNNKLKKKKCNYFSSFQDSKEASLCKGNWGTRFTFKSMPFNLKVDLLSFNKEWNIYLFFLYFSVFIDKIGKSTGKSQ